MGRTVRELTTSSLVRGKVLPEESVVDVAWRNPRTSALAFTPHRLTLL